MDAWVDSIPGRDSAYADIAKSIRRALAQKVPHLQTSNGSSVQGGVTVDDVDRMFGPMYEDGRLNLAALDEHLDRIKEAITKQEERG